MERSVGSLRSEQTCNDLEWVIRLPHPALWGWDFGGPINSGTLGLDSRVTHLLIFGGKLQLTVECVGRVRSVDEVFEWVRLPVETCS